MSALRTKKGLSARDVVDLDVVDLALIEGVEADLPLQMLLRSAACSEEEAYGRLMRLISLGLLEELAALGLRNDTSSTARAASACASSLAAAGERGRACEPARELSVGAATGIRARPAREVLHGARPTSRESEPPRATTTRARIAASTGAPARKPTSRGQLAVREELPTPSRRDARTLDSLPPSEKSEAVSCNITAPEQDARPSTRNNLAVTMVDTSFQSLARTQFGKDSKTEAAQGAKTNIQRALSTTMVDDSSSELAQEHIARRSLPPERRAPVPAEKSAQPRAEVSSRESRVAGPAMSRRAVRSPDASEGRLDRSRTVEWTPQHASVEPEEWPVPSASMSERAKAPARMGLGSEPCEEAGPLYKYPTGTVVGIGPPTPGLPLRRRT
jgi:hypothetical protein